MGAACPFEAVAVVVDDDDGGGGDIEKAGGNREGHVAVAWHMAFRPPLKLHEEMFQSKHHE